MEKDTLLEVTNLKVQFTQREGTFTAVDGVSFSLKRGEVLGVAGESGCGKSVTSQAILRILPQNGKIADGSIRFRRKNGEEVDLTELDPKGQQIRSIRGDEISMIFQEPMTSFSPVYTIENQISEVIRLHQQVSKKGARQQTIEILGKVGMPKPEQIVDAYPFNLSGGMRQRAMIAMALSCKPSLLIADEPTTAVDVTTQAIVLRLIRQLQREINMALIMISHDLAVISEIAHKVVIMYLGKEVEYARTDDMFYDTKHPYSQGLIASIPRLGEASEQLLTPISGSVPGPFELPAGCPFHPRCPQIIRGICEREVPAFYQVGEEHYVRCFLYKNGESNGAE